MTLAVLNGADAGKVLRTGRPRVLVGAANDNDLVLTDSDIHAHHFSIIVDDGGWRAQTQTSKQQIVIDRRWSHPETGKRGALIYAGGTEILLYPGDLDDRTIEREIKLRATADVTVPETEESNDVTRIADARFTRDMRSVPPSADDVGNAPTISLPKLTGLRPGERIDPIAMASMPTLAGAQIPKGIQEAAGRGIRVEPDPRPVVTDPVESQRRSSAWDRAAGRGSERRSEAPEVLAEPESRMAPMPGSERSVVAEPAQGGAWSPNPSSGSSGGRAMVRVDPSSAGRNAWGDRVGGAKRPSEPPPQPQRGTNAWGDRPQRESEAPPPPREPAQNAWGDRSSGGGRSTQPPPPANPRLPQLYSGHELTVADLAQRIGDPALQLLKEPDGDFATAVRVFGTRLLDLARTYGYRAYMITSAEPLTGKTTVATNLAFALAEDPKRRVALIEANFRFPRFAEILGVDEKIGLLGVLEGRLQVPESIVKVADRNLVVFPAGGRHPHPAEVLASPRFKTLIAELASTVDVAIIDAPSVRPFADANLILPLVDGALMVALEESTRGIWIDRAVEQLGKERVLGALYNRVDKEARRTLAEERKVREDASGKS